MSTAKPPRDNNKTMTAERFTDALLHQAHVTFVSATSTCKVFFGDDALVLSHLAQLMGAIHDRDFYMAEDRLAKIRKALSP